MRPQSIIWFERLYLGAWAIGLVNTVATWSSSFGRMQADPATAMAPAILYVSTAIGFVIPLLLWFFIARQGSVVAKWILVVLFAIGLGGIAWSAAEGRLLGGLPGMIALLATALQAGAVWCLFRRDAVAWLGTRTPAADL